MLYRRRCSLNLDETERCVTLRCSAMTPELDTLVSQLKQEGFEVAIAVDVSRDQPSLRADVGEFVGMRSMRGFLKGYKRIFDVAHDSARQLSTE